MSDILNNWSCDKGKAVVMMMVTVVRTRKIVFNNHGSCCSNCKNLEIRVH